jgi:hypothetical protein
MAIAVISEVPVGTLDQYDAVNEKLQATGGGMQEGHVFHCVGAMEGGGFRVFDVWETREGFDRFVEETLGPAIEEVTQGQAGEPNRTIYELHNVMS